MESLLIQSPNLSPAQSPPELIHSEIICVIGQRGSGKTTLVKNTIIPSLPRFIIYDSINEYDDIPSMGDARTVRDFIDLLEIGDNIRIPGDSEISFQETCQIINDGVYNYYFVVDEFHLLFDHHMKFQADNPAFKKLVLLGRHSGIGLVIISQRPTDIPKFVLSQSTRLYVFYIYHKDDIKFISHVVNNPEVFQTLQLYEYYRIDFVSPVIVVKEKTKI